MDYVSIDQFDQGWKFFAKEIKDIYGRPKYDGKFPCSKFWCFGCDDWLSVDKHNRKVDKV